MLKTVCILALSLAMILSFYSIAFASCSAYVDECSGGDISCSCDGRGSCSATYSGGPLGMWNIECDCEDGSYSMGGCTTTME